MSARMRSYTIRYRMTAFAILLFVQCTIYVNYVHADN